MVEQQLRARDILDARVLDVMRAVPRHRFVRERDLDDAYDDRPLSIGDKQTISQPYIVALMTQLVQPQPQERALDVGSGCGYQTAVLAGLVRHVDAVEIVPELASAARDRLASLGYANVDVHCADGHHGWPAGAPFDVIVVAACGREVPPALVAQLAPGGRLIGPVGGARDQSLVLVEKSADGASVRMRDVAPVKFVPLVTSS